VDEALEIYEENQDFFCGFYDGQREETVHDDE